ncbi:PREDICTED: collagen alpha-1(I) chain-like isoform X2 [Cyphomyrmex costatus]|uniref:collagen alpha-1(I) chain-like isoform X2 n=1 Tax=Cyphomyrmex costatus TaxID=456900 RepID=UPI0008523149|nr:PREDICTED: collagen alpha-1(I) chain-like isoform X2 [Cyphomyrmex costatus]
MWIRSLQCSLVVFFACAFLAGSDSVSAGAYNGAGASLGSALSSTSVLEGTENVPDAHDRHKEIRSYDSTGFPQDNNANRGVKSYGTPSGHGASHDHGIKGGGHGYNKNDDCSKCKWENDEYWERDEPEEEGDENDGDECDDGQYRPDKVHHHSPGRGHKPGSHPPGVHKTGPTGVYVDGGGGSPGASLGGINYPGTEYSRPISSYESTPKPGFSWNTPFADASKPGYSSVTPSAFGTTPSSWPDWNRGTTPGSFGSSPKPSWDGGRDGRFPSSQRPGAPVPNFDATTKPGQRWPSNQFPSSSFAVPHAGSTISPSYGNPQEYQNRPYGQPGTQSTYAGAYAGASVTSGVGSPYGATSNFGSTDHPFDLHKPANTQAPQGPPYGKTDQAPSNIDSNYYGLGGYNKPRPGPYNTPTTIINTIGTTKGPYERIDSSKTVPGPQTDLFAPRKSPGSLGTYEHPGVTKPSYGSTTSWLGQTESGSSTWHGTGSTPHSGFPTLNTGFGTTKSPFSHVSTPSSILSPPYDRTGPKQPNFNIASSSAIASAGSSAFGTSPGTYSTPSITRTTSLYGTTPAYRGSSSYTPGVKDSIGSTKPAYGTVPHTYPNIESDTWPRGLQPGSGTGPWTSGKPGDGSGITPSTYSPGINRILPAKQPQGGGTWPSEQPTRGSGGWPSKQPGDGSGIWPGQAQPRPGSGPGCGPGGNCGGTTGLQGGSNCGGCCGNYNCNSGCSGKDNVSTHGLCGGVIGPSGVNKTYYPAGTGDGNVPNIGAYRPDSLHNTEAGIRPIYPETQGSTPSSNSNPWIENTDNNKPIGPGNPFLDSSWNRPKPGYSNNDRNVIPHEEKPIPEGNNPFLIPLIGGSGDSGSPSYGKYPDRSGTPGNYPGSGTPGNYPGSGTPGNYPGVGTPGNYPGSGTSGNYPGSGTSGNYPGSRIPGNYPGSGTPGNYPSSRTPGNYPGSGTPGNYPGSRTPGNYPGSRTPGNYPGSGAPENYPGSGTPENFPSSGIPGNYPGSGTPENFPISGIPGNYPGSRTPGNYLGSGTPENYPGSRTPGNYPGSGTPGSYPGSGSNPQGPDPLQCKLGLFGCGTPGSGSYADGKYPGGTFSGNVGTGTGNPKGVGNVPGGNLGGFATSADHPGSGGNLAASISGAQARAYAGSFSSAQASSSSFAGSFPGAPGSANNFGNLSPAQNGAQNQGGPNSWASSGASAFASSNAGSWSGNHPVDVKG